jgi:hypothetical protein
MSSCHGIKRSYSPVRKSTRVMMKKIVKMYEASDAAPAPSYTDTDKYLLPITQAGKDGKLYAREIKEIEVVHCQDQASVETDRSKFLRMFDLSPSEPPKISVGTSSVKRVSFPCPEFFAQERRQIERAAARKKETAKYWKEQEQLMKATKCTEILVDKKAVVTKDEITKMKVPKCVVPNKIVADEKEIVPKDEIRNTEIKKTGLKINTPREDKENIISTRISSRLVIKRSLEVVPVKAVSVKAVSVQAVSKTIKKENERQRKINQAQIFKRRKPTITRICVPTVFSALQNITNKSVVEVLCVPNVAKSGKQPIVEKGAVLVTTPVRSSGRPARKRKPNVRFEGYELDGGEQTKIKKLDVIESRAPVV